MVKSALHRLLPLYASRILRPPTFNHQPLTFNTVLIISNFSASSNLPMIRLNPQIQLPFRNPNSTLSIPNTVRTHHSPQPHVLPLLHPPPPTFHPFHSSPQTPIKHTIHPTSHPQPHRHPPPRRPKCQPTPQLHSFIIRLGRPRPTHRLRCTLRGVSHPHHA